MLLSQRAAWKITDFDFTMTGGSKLAYSTNSAHGTDCYRAPELVKGEDPIVTMKSDIWALGCIMHELLTGLKAFPNDWNAWRYYSDSSLGLSDPPLPEFLSPQSHKCIRMLLNQVLTREWWKRPSAAEILDLLNAVAIGPTQVYLGVRGNMEVGPLVGIDPDSDLWKTVEWKQYWFAPALPC